MEASSGKDLITLVEMNAAELRKRYDEALALIESLKANVEAKQTALDEAAKTIARLSAPVSQDEIFTHRSHATNGGFGNRDGLLNAVAVAALIAARLSPTQPAPEVTP